MTEPSKVAQDAPNSTNPRPSRRYSLIRVLILSCCCVLVLFFLLTSMAYYRLNDFETALSGIATRSLPEIVRTGQVYSQVNELSYLTERLANTSTQASRRIAYQEIQLKTDGLVDDTVNKAMDSSTSGYLQAIVLELGSLNKLIEQHLQTQHELNIHVVDMYEFLDSAVAESLQANQTSNANDKNQAAVDNWALAASEIIALAGKGMTSMRLNQIRNLSQQLAQRLDNLLIVSHQLPANYALRSEQLRKMLLDKNGLLPLKSEQLRIIGRTTGHSNFVRNLILDFAQLMEFQSFEYHRKVIAESERISQQVSQQIRLLGLVSVITLLLLIAVIYFVQQRLIKRLKLLNQNVLSKLVGQDLHEEITGNDEITDIDHSFQFFTEQIDAQKRSLQLLSLTDGLTGVANRRALDERLENEIVIAARKQWTSSILLLDVDYFKAFNDHYGHLKGDDCLKQIVHILRECKQRNTDFIARFGGEEFIYILPDTALEGAKHVAQSILEAFSKAKIPHAKNPQGPFVTVSIGITTFNHNIQNETNSILINADKALYQAKTKGKNQFQIYLNNNNPDSVI
ncbi:diguanylate cyclase [Alteromonadaceae bacterium BrNp21-10]|nr:diguanylate cyclase [Alteromonadaceae bacterium BrNp21-10]